MDIEPEVIDSKDEAFINIDTAVRKFTVTASDVYDADDAKSYTSNLTVKFSQNGTTVTRTATVVVFNTDAITPSKLPGIVKCIAPANNPGGLGNTDNNKIAADKDIIVGIHVVDVYAIGSAYVYGYDVENGISMFTEIKSLSKSADIKAQEDKLPDEYYVALYLNGKLLNTIDERWAPAINEHDGKAPGEHGTYIEVKVRDSFENIFLSLIDWDKYYSILENTQYAKLDMDAATASMATATGAYATAVLAGNADDIKAAQKAYATAEKELASATKVYDKGKADFNNFVRKYDKVPTADHYADIDKMASNDATLITLDYYYELGAAKPAILTEVLGITNRYFDLDGDRDIDELDRALALDKIKEVVVKADIYDLYNTNTMESSQVTSTWKKGQVTKYDDYDQATFTNNDVKNYAAVIDFENLVYEGDIPGNANEWSGWFEAHSKLTAHRWTNVKDEGAKRFAFVSATALGVDDELLDFKVSTMARDSKYLQNAGLFFHLDGTTAEDPTDAVYAGGIVTYVPYVIGKKVSQYNYQYKTENEVPDGEIGGIWGD